MSEHKRKDRSPVASEVAGSGASWGECLRGPPAMNPIFLEEEGATFPQQSKPFPRPQTRESSQQRWRNLALGLEPVAEPLLQHVYADAQGAEFPFTF